MIIFPTTERVIKSRGLKEDDMVKVAEWMKQAIDAREDEAKLAAINEEVKAFALKFPLPTDK